MIRKFRHISVLAMATFISAMMAMPAAAKPPKAKDADKVSKFEVPTISQSVLPMENIRVPRWVQQRISYSQAKSIALRRYPGAKYIDTRLNGNTYTVKLVLKNNQMVNVKIDAVTGRIR